MYIFLVDVQGTALRATKRFALSAAPSTIPFKAQTKEEAKQHPILDFLWTGHTLKKINLQGNSLTITGDESTDWEALGRSVSSFLKTYTPPATKTESQNQNWKEELTPFQVSELEELQSIFDQTIRPVLQKDHGDIIISFFDSNLLKLTYQGSCTSCGFSTTSTLSFIESTIHSKFPKLVISLS